MSILSALTAIRNSVLVPPELDDEDLIAEVDRLGVLAAELRRESVAATELADTVAWLADDEPEHEPDGSPSIAGRVIPWPDGVPAFQTIDEVLDAIKPDADAHAATSGRESRAPFVVGMLCSNYDHLHRAFCEVARMLAAAQTRARMDMEGGE